jgi:glycosyltransferase involved in cell wall biosynthesis
MDRPLVSAVIIFLNGERYLVEAIDSVLAQGYPELELLLIDDGSSDRSPAIALDYAERHPDKVRVLSHPGHVNRGMSASRNLGVANAKGTYIAFLDADDVWLPTKIEEQVRILVKHPEVALLYGRTQIWHSWQDAQSGKDFFYPLGVAAEQVQPPPHMLGNLVDNRFQTPTTCNAIISRAAYERLGGFEESFRGMYEDQAFFAKLFLEYPTYVSDTYWARYRQRAGSTSGPFSYRDYYQERRRFMEFIYRRSRRHWPTLDDWTRAVIRRELWRARNPRLAAIAQHARRRWPRFFSA